MEIVLNTSKTSKKIPHGIKSRKLKKSRKHNDKKNKGKVTNNNEQNSTQQTMK